MQAALAPAARGDHSAFRDIVRGTQAMVFSIAYHFFHDRTVAEDATQDVFLRLYQNLHAIKSSAHLVQWLRQVTSRRCIDLARRSPVHAPLSLEDAPEPVADDDSPDLLLSRKLRCVVAALPEDARMVVILRYQEDLSLAEIAEILEIPINTVKSRLQRSLAHLRERLDNVEEISRHAGS
jgi:RNA polymerase sigma-70 factor (ECF subfamily)